MASIKDYELRFVRSNYCLNHNKCVQNESMFVFSRVSTPKDKANARFKTTNIPTSTSNRYHCLQNWKVSENLPPNNLDGNSTPNTLGGKTSVTNNSNLRTNRSEKSGKTNDTHNSYLRTNRSEKKTHNHKQTRNQNPTGDIWDQKSLNLDFLFRNNLNESLRICIWNAESVRHKENLVKKYILDNDIDVFVVLESWLDQDELPSTNDIIPCKETYRLHQMPRPNRKNSSGGGMLCISKQNIDVAKMTSIKPKLLEIMDLKISYSSKTLRLVSVYRPPRSEVRRYPVADFYDDMEALVSHYKTVSDETILCGDYNVHWNKPTESETRRFRNIIESANLQQHINGQTHVKGNTLDLIMTEKGSSLIKSWMIDEFLSDHATIRVDLSLDKPAKITKQVTFRKNKEIDINELDSKIDTNLKELGNLSDLNNLNELVDKFNQAISDAYNDLAPLQTKKLIIRPPTPWSYDDIKQDKATRRKLERRWRLTGLQVDWEIYKDFRNKFNAKLNDFRNKQFSEMIEQNKDDPTTLFRVINKALHRKQSSPLPPGLSNKQLANKFSTFFTEKIDKIRTNVDQKQAELINEDSARTEPVNIPHKMRELSLLTENEVELMIKEFPNKQCGLDPIPLSMLKQCLPTVLGHITKIVNLSLKLGDLPTKLKMALIRPLLKKIGLEPELLKNYRPVSNLAFLSKLIEKIVANQFVNHLVRNNLMDSLQSAYKKGHSTETALLKVQNDILTDIDNKRVSVLVLLDLSAAFDTIDHEILLKRLNTHYGIEGNALKWFRSYLMNRSQSVIIDDDVSEPKTLKYGVPQGSVLGPLLFTAYMAPLKETIIKHGLQYHCYADDTQLYISFSPNIVEDEAKTIESLEKAIEEVKHFMISNRLKLNDDKTEAMFLGTKSKLNQVKSAGINVGDSKIEPANSVKNLGIIFDKNLNMDEQVKSMCKAGFYHVKNLWRIRKFLDQMHANIAAHAFITSKLDYGNALLAGSPKYQVKRLQSVQNAAARVVTKTKKYDHISEKMKDLNWLPVNYRIKYKVNLLTWKALNGRAPDYISGMLSEREPGRDLRTGKNKVLNVPKSNLKTMGDKAFSVVGPKAWNQLPKDLRLTENLKSFKTGLRSLFTKEAYSGLD